MFTLENENIIRVVSTETEKENLLKKGYVEVKVKTKRATKEQVKEDA